MDSGELMKRAKKFSLDIIHLIDSLPNNKIGDVLEKTAITIGNVGWSKLSIGL